MTNPPSLIEFLQHLAEPSDIDNEKTRARRATATLVMEFLKENTIPAMNYIIHGGDVCAHAEFIRDIIIGADKLEEDESNSVKYVREFRDRNKLEEKK